MKLYELHKNDNFMLLDDDTMQVFTFSKVDGMYSVCFNSDGEIVHIKAYADVVLVVG